VWIVVCDFPVAIQCGLLFARAGFHFLKGGVAKFLVGLKTFTQSRRGDRAKFWWAGVEDFIRSRG
jgi:hypothetical protein